MTTTDRGEESAAAAASSAVAPNYNHNHHDEEEEYEYETELVPHPTRHSDLRQYITAPANTLIVAEDDNLTNDDDNSHSPGRPRVRIAARRSTPTYYPKKPKEAAAAANKVNVVAEHEEDDEDDEGAVDKDAIEIPPCPELEEPDAVQVQEDPPVQVEEQKDVAEEEPDPKEEDHTITPPHSPVPPDDQETTTLLTFDQEQHITTTITSYKPREGSPGRPVNRVATSRTGIFRPGHSPTQAEGHVVAQNIPVRFTSLAEDEYGGASDELEQVETVTQETVVVQVTVPVVKGLTGTTSRTVGSNSK